LALMYPLVIIALKESGHRSRMDWSLPPAYGIMVLVK